jgi:hypothetical protein
MGSTLGMTVEVARRMRPTKSSNDFIEVGGFTINIKGLQKNGQLFNK